jgi:iron complex outermembrane receptor protein
MRTLLMVVFVSLFSGTVAFSQEPRTQLRVVVRSEGQPVAGATVVAGSRSGQTDADGVAQLDAVPGTATVTATKEGFFDGKGETQVTAGQVATVEIELTAQPDLEEEVVVVASTRTGRRLEDQPTRVEVIGREEIEEKLLMTPGDIVMMLNEMGGLRVQATSPSIGAASVRVQGMKGRYTRFLSDGLPLFGQQVGGLGLLQIPPMDLGQVEVIKGVASAFYGAGAMGGVVNLLSRRPGDEPTYDALFNASTLSATDAVMYIATAAREGWTGSKRSRRRRLGRCGGIPSRHPEAAGVLGRRQRSIRLPDCRRDLGGSGWWHDRRRDPGGNRRVLSRSARHPSLRHGRHGTDAGCQPLRAHGPRLRCTATAHAYVR